MAAKKDHSRHCTPSEWLSSSASNQKKIVLKKCSLQKLTLKKGCKAPFLFMDISLRHKKTASKLLVYR